MGISPGFLLAALVVWIVTQAARVSLGARGPYLATLGLSVAGLIGGEMLAGTGHLGHPALGVLHPVADVLVMAVAQVAGSLLFSPRSEPGA